MRTFAAIAAIGLFVTSVHAQAVTAEVTRIEHKGDTWEIELRSASEFPMGAQPLVLHIGSQSFKRSRQLRDLKRVVFFLDAAQYASLVDGDAMSVTYGDAADAPRWVVPAFRKPSP